MNTVLLVAFTIAAEAGNQPAEGKLAVASVIWNRAEQSARSNPLTWDQALTRCILHPKQFSCWNDEYRETTLIGDNVDASCLWLAHRIVDRSFMPTLMATHYHAKNVTPEWAPSMKLIAMIGDHLFYKS